MAREIDIVDVFLILWSRRLRLGLSLIIGIVAGVIYLFAFPQKSEVRVLVNKLPESTFVDLDLIYANSNISSEHRETLVNAHVSYDEFTTMFLARTELANAAFKHSESVRKLQSDQGEKAAWKQALQSAYQYRLLPYEQTSNAGLISYKTSNLDESYKVLVTAVQEISKRIAARNREAIQGLI